MNEWQDKYNPFNSLKALVHVEYWKPIIKGLIPSPRFVSIDPCSYCNFSCPHCNSSKILDQLKLKMSEETMEKTIDLLKYWGVLSGCIGGGGESLLNPVTYNLIDKLVENNIETGVVSNGSVILDKNKLLKCKWVGFSMDAATAGTYSKMKGVSADYFERVINNIKSLTNRGTEISFKFLLHPNNYTEIYDAAKLAKEIGCNLIHIRPGAEPWFNPDTKSWNFDEKMVDTIRQDSTRIQNELADDKFKVYDITHKFNSDFSVKKSFNKCWACMTTCVINSKGEVGLCCDRRGDTNLTLCTVDNAREMWGSDTHFKIHESVDVNSCPRCTYSHINEIFENVIIEDRMMCNMY